MDPKHPKIEQQQKAIADKFETILKIFRKAPITSFGSLLLLTRLFSIRTYMGDFTQGGE